MLKESKIFSRIRELIEAGDVKISAHGYDELSSDGIFVKDVLANVNNANILEEYPEFPKGPCVLVLQKDARGKPIHVVWGIPKAANSPAVLVTAYRPDPNKWSKDFRRRK
ncbi:MAG: hypothetical protein A2Z20_11690 [Bdellovibrionales bacterium RBG_16_40_8]|nr:MAG: hypothetical protein A2Z20_11690 [Bdellovibrionales bacterium RBG_16_40_8]